jgi:hypothetical protein
MRHLRRRRLRVARRPPRAGAIGMETGKLVCPFLQIFSLFRFFFFKTMQLLRSRANVYFCPPRPLQSVTIVDIPTFQSPDRLRFGSSP